ncbi:MAG: glutamate--tRNA ligase [Ruminococcaceae bacterium]|nr:glutamate--tRNA ligase [Oscillospiraceae bacterium]
MSKVRTRFAPSPTGYMHIGNLRTALYAYLIAKKDGGDFILRIEDTDQERYVDGAVDLIYRTMAETGLIHDEGPDIGGNYGPYVQSERLGLYQEYAKKLVELGGAYYCFCDKERLDNLRAQQEAAKLMPKYDGHCAHLSKEEIEEKLASGVPYVIRQKIPRRGTTSFYDEIYGKITVDNATLDDNILLKSDGYPTYNFANVIDDHLMNITHIIRGSEYLSSTPKYNLLYEAFGWEIPTYIHVSPVMRDAHKKLSKRDGDASYEDFINKGYLKEAVLNYIALLGWSPGGEQEIFTLDELTRAFDIKGISKSPAIFDPMKLDWLNGEYIRKLPFDAFYEKALPFIREAVKGENVDTKKIASLLHDRCEKLSDIPEQLDFIDALPDYEPALYCHKKMKTNEENSLASLQEILPVLETISDWSYDAIHEALFALIAKLEVKNGLILWPLRVAVSGKAFTPGGGVELAEILGKDETIKRVKQGIALLSK